MSLVVVSGIVAASRGDSSLLGVQVLLPLIRGNEAENLPDTTFAKEYERLLDLGSEVIGATLSLAVAVGTGSDLGSG